MTEYGYYRTPRDHYLDTPTLLHRELDDFFRSRYALFPNLQPVELFFYGIIIADEELQELEAVKGTRTSRREGLDT